MESKIWNQSRGTSHHLFSTVDFSLNVLRLAWIAANAWHISKWHTKHKLQGLHNIETYLILFRSSKSRASAFLLVDSCRARAQLSNAVSNTFWFQKLTEILPLTWSLPKISQIYAYRPSYHAFFYHRCMQMMFYK